MHSRKDEDDYGQLYNDLRFIEMFLHQFIKRALIEAYGAGEEGWWRTGIPKAVRIKCQSRREDDDSDELSEPYGYTDLIDLRGIIDYQWHVLNSHLKPDARSNKKKVLSSFIQLNRIRRYVMHPARGLNPSLEDLAFVEKVKNRLLIRETELVESTDQEAHLDDSA